MLCTTTCAPNSKTRFVVSLSVGYTKMHICQEAFPLFALYYFTCMFSNYIELTAQLAFSSLPRKFPLTLSERVWGRGRMSFYIYFTHRDFIRFSCKWFVVQLCSTSFNMYDVRSVHMAKVYHFVRQPFISLNHRHLQRRWQKKTKLSLKMHCIFFWGFSVHTHEHKQHHRSCIRCLNEMHFTVLHASKVNF